PRLPQLAQLVEGAEKQEAEVAGLLAYLGGPARAVPVEVLPPLEPALEHQVAQRPPRRGAAGPGVVGDELEADGAQPPGPLAPLAALGLLDVAVFRQRPQVVGDRRRRAADQRRSPRRGEAAVHAERLV